ILESYQDFLDITYRNVSDETLELITKARDLLKKDLAESEAKYLKFQQETPVLWKGKDGVHVDVERIVSVEARRSARVIRRTELQERIRFVEKALAEGKDAEVMMVVARTSEKPSGAEKSLDEQLLPLLLQEQQLLESYGEDHPQVKSVRSRIALI